MKRMCLYILTMFILADISAKDFYLTGEFNGWTPNQSECKFVEINGSYTLFMQQLTGELKITTAAWEEQFGCDFTIEYGNTYPCVMTGNGSNFKMPEDPANNVTLTFDYLNRTLRVEKVVNFYLSGDFNNWLLLTDYKFEYYEGIYSLIVEPFDGRFKIISDDKEYIFGANRDLTFGREISLMSGGGALNAQAATDKYWKFTFNPNSDFMEEEASTPLIERGEEVKVEFFTIDGIRIETPTRGLYIKKTGNKTEKIIL